MRNRSLPSVCAQNSVTAMLTVGFCDLCLLSRVSSWTQRPLIPGVLSPAQGGQSRACMSLNWLCVLVTQLCPTLCNPMDRLLCPWTSPGKNIGVGSHSLLQEIFLTQGLYPGLPHCRRILYHLSHQGSPQNWLICTNSSASAFEGISRYNIINE